MSRNYGMLLALTVLKLSVGSVVCPSEFRPQQATVLSLSIPQLWNPPALTVLKHPSAHQPSPTSCLSQALRPYETYTGEGASILSPKAELFPQQATVLSLRIPQLWRLPALTVLKAPVGASACPPKSLFPQQATVLLLRIPQLWL